MRIEAAKELLANSGEKVASIALSVGYDTSHYFHRTFKKVTGITPVQYRERGSLRKKNHS
jgi:YesN/AraC family two-component response regulator